MRVIIPFPPGAINDTVGRLIATELTNRLGKQFIVDNRAGAGGVVGSELAANAPKDGYTLLVVSLGEHGDSGSTNSTTSRLNPLRRSRSWPLRPTFS